MLACSKLISRYWLLHHPCWLDFTWLGMARLFHMQGVGAGWVESNGDHKLIDERAMAIFERGLATGKLRIMVPHKPDPGDGPGKSKRGGQPAAARPIGGTAHAGQAKYKEMVSCSRPLLTCCWQCHCSGQFTSNSATRMSIAGLCHVSCIGLSKLHDKYWQ